MVEQVNPYVISSDAKGLFESWTASNGFVSPRHDYFDGATRDLQSILETYFPEGVEIVSETELRAGINGLARSTPFDILSMDRAYVDKNTPQILGHIDVTRAVDQDLKPLGLMPRPGFPPISEQLDAFRANETQPIVLLDDVVFNGGGILWLSRELRARNRKVVGVIAGIGITEKGLKRVRDVGIEVRCVKEYPDVVDEVCQRDFLAGIPMAGRTMHDTDGKDWSAPYFRPFGDPEDWATIPTDKVAEFSEFCLEQSVEIWRRTEQRSASSVPAQAVPRPWKGINFNNGSVVSELLKLKEK